MFVRTRLAILLLAGPVAAAGQTNPIVVSDAKSAYTICIREAAEPEVFAAQELARYLDSMTGVRLPVISEGVCPEKAILIGRAAPASVQSELKNQSEDAFLIRKDGERLILAGASPRATLYAVYAFLETLGVAFPRPSQSHIEQQVEAPGPQEELIPRLEKLELRAVDRLEKPAFAYRALVHFPMEKERTIREIDWMAKNKLNWSHLITNTEFKQEWDRNDVRKSILPELRKRGLHVEGIGHSFFAYIPPEKYAAEHPEYFAMGADGKRLVEPGRGGLCVSNPEVVKLMASNMDQFLRENPEIEIIDLWTNDSAAWCLCPNCKRMQGIADDATHYGTTTRSYLRFVNGVAERLAPGHPKIRVNALAYALNMLPDPETEPADNVIMGIAPWGRITYKGSDDYYIPLKQPGRVNSVLHPALLGWLKLAKDVYLYDYYANRIEFFPIVDTLRTDYQYYQQIGLKGLSTEIFYWPEFNMWAYSRLSWNPQTPLRELVNQFCSIAYRGASEPMTRFYMTLERWKWEWPKHRDELSPHLKEAQARAAADETVQSKLKRIEKVLATEPTKNWPHDEPPPALID